MYQYLLLVLCAIHCILFAEPPREIPPELYNQFTLDGKIPVKYSYSDDTYSSNDPKIYSKADIDLRVNMILKKETGHYGQTDLWIYEALERYPIRNKEVVIIGSASPWYESVVIAYGGHPTTIEYNKIVSDDPRLIVMTPEEYNQNPKKFDVVLSVSSIEHDGLGRYGDPINPYADFEFMEFAKSKLLKKGGHMILSLPIGQDVLEWNLHRIYGRIRFPLLIAGWNLLDKFGFNEAEFNGAFGNYGYQPVFYLAPGRNKK